MAIKNKCTFVVCRHCRRFGGGSPLTFFALFVALIILHQFKLLKLSALIASDLTANYGCHLRRLLSTLGALSTSSFMQLD